MADNEKTRRRFLVGIGTTAAVGIAGCTAAPRAEQNQNDTPGGTATDSGGDTHGTEHSDTSGTEHPDDHESELVTPSENASVSMATMDGGSHFEPHVVWVNKGGTVTWELESGSHTTTAYAGENDSPQRTPDGGNAWDSGTLSEQGATFEHTFETTGVYDYFCVPHEASGMVGTVIVGEPTSTDGPGLQSPQDSLPTGAAEKIESLNERVRPAISGSDGSGDGGHHDGTTTDSVGDHHDETTTTHSGDGHH